MRCMINVEFIDDFVVVGLIFKRMCGGLLVSPGLLL